MSRQISLSNDVAPDIYLLAFVAKAKLHLTKVFAKAGLDVVIIGYSMLSASAGR